MSVHAVGVCPHSTSRDGRPVSSLQLKKETKRNMLYLPTECCMVLVSESACFGMSVWHQLVAAVLSALQEVCRGSIAVAGILAPMHQRCVICIC